MPTREQVMKSLDMVMVPSAMRSLVKLNLVREVNVADRKIEIAIANAALAPQAQDWLREKINQATGPIVESKNVTVDFVDSKPKDLNEIGQVIAVMSGKGGVGKSLVASLAGTVLRRQGYEVGILDADITGPSIPRMFGIKSRPAGSDTGILPASSRSGIAVMSINLLLPSEDDAVVWRGPLIGRAITQFWEEVLWGKLDYLIVDLPPGTADAPLTVLQTLPVSGIIIVFTPQDLTTMIVRKAVKMARQMDKSVLGVVENMSYLYVPEIDRKIELFGKSRAEEMAKVAGAPLLAQLPIDPELATLCDRGDVERYDSGAVQQLAKSLSELISGKTQRFR
jgi:hydrogenase maturation protease